MSKPSSSSTAPDSDVHISHENQKKINRFAIMNGWVEEIQDSLEVKKTFLGHLDDAENDIENSEVLLLEPELPVSIVVGENFVEFGGDEVKETIEALKEKTRCEIKGLEDRVGGIKSEMDELKKSLYKQFGSNINLESDGGSPSFK